MARTLKHRAGIAVALSSMASFFVVAAQPTAANAALPYGCQYDIRHWSNASTWGTEFVGQCPKSMPGTQWTATLTIRNSTGQYYTKSLSWNPQGSWRIASVERATIEYAGNWKYNQF